MMEKRLGDLALEDSKTEYKGKLLHEKDPHSVRAKLILKNIIQGLERLVKRNPDRTLQAFTDGEVAAVIAHEVGHVVARHHVEFLDVLVNKPKLELEADYIGLLLMASAGYNPRIAVELRKNISLSNPGFLKEDHNYPSYEERANSLTQAHVMEQALTIYKESGRNILLT
ncbi:hypothetical protein IFM89_036137 [Coptis chinensis]|uniref:Peptidase M48 domain-containing protein n=1 Tax=Coptis chinensis TaxID=261450 RepID=A0A835HPK8_9MAGN|nr:hypothetical protein IFM89_036137 [Coptis chinensis]